MIYCDHCERGFNNKKSLSNHKRWHDLPQYQEFQKQFKDKTKISKTGVLNPAWKGSKASYAAIHYWVRKNKPKPELCVNCNKRKSFEVHNIDKKYTRDLNQWEWLCRSCHLFKEGRSNVLV